MDDNKPVQFQDQPAGEAPGSASTVAPDQGKGPEYLTRDDLLSTLEEWNRKQQGLRRKQENRIKSMVQGMVDAANEAGQEVTPQLKAAFERKAQQTTIEPDDEQEDPTPAPAKAKPTAPAAPQPAAHWVDQAISEIQKATKTTITVADEGAAELEALKNAGDAVGFIAKYRELAQQKAEAHQSIEANEARVRMPTAASGGSRTSLEAEYREQLSKIRRGDIMAITALQAQYRAKGAKI